MSNPNEPPAQPPGDVIRQVARITALPEDKVRATLSGADNGGRLGPEDERRIRETYRFVIAERLGASPRRPGEDANTPYPTMNEIAFMVGVKSYTTVSKVLNGKGTFAADTVDRIRLAAEATGYPVARLERKRRGAERKPAGEEVDVTVRLANGSEWAKGRCRVVDRSTTGAKLDSFSLDRGAIPTVPFVLELHTDDGDGNGTVHAEPVRFAIEGSGFGMGVRLVEESAAGSNN